MDVRTVKKLGVQLFGRRFRLDVRDVYDKSMEEFNAGLQRRRDLESEWKVLRDQQRKLQKNLMADFRREARFVVDVQGDPPSIEQLEAVLVRAEQVAELQDQMDDLQAEKKKIRQRFRHRYEAGYSDGMFHYIVASGNTLDELVTRMRKEAGSKA